MKVTAAFIALVFVGSLSARLSAQPQDAGNAVAESELHKLLRPYYYDEASRYAFRPTPQGMVLALVDKPVLTWTGRQDGGISSGDVFVWTNEGRAELIGCIGSFGSDEIRSVFHEFHALTKAKLPEVRVGPDRWHPDRPGVDFRVLPDADVPIESSRGRLAQMRSLAREFEVRFDAPVGDDVYLRRLPSPIFRNRLTKGDLGDGALFAFVWNIGTDPEFLLLLESLPTDAGYRWHYSPVRFNHRALWLEHRGKEVWNATRLFGRRSEPYVSLVTGSKSVKELKESAKRGSSDSE